MQFAPTVPLALIQLLEAIDVERMHHATRVLCSATFAGRRMGTEGHDRATRFLVEQFRQAGWQTSIEEFALTTPVLDVSAPLQLELLTDDGRRERSLSRRIEFCEHPRSASHSEAVEGKVVRLSTEASFQQNWVMVQSVPQGAAFTALAAHLAQQGASVQLQHLLTLVEAVSSVGTPRSKPGASPLAPAGGEPEVERAIVHSLRTGMRLPMRQIQDLLQTLHGVQVSTGEIVPRVAQREACFNAAASNHARCPRLICGQAVLSRHLSQTDGVNTTATEAD